MRHPLAISTWDDRELAAAMRVLVNGRTTMGEEVSAFEREFAEFTGTEYAVMVNSGSSANLLMVAALVYTGRLRRGARVAVPAVSWSTTYAPLEQFGMRLVVVDVDASMNIAPGLIPRNVDAIFAVNLLGNPCDYSHFPSGPIVLEDNCEATGAKYQGRRTGSIGLMASHSLFFSHHMNTMEGGVITTDDAELWRALVALRAHGWTRDWPEYEPGFSSFQFALPGYSVRPTEIQGAIGRIQLKKLPWNLDIRRKNGAAYRRLIGHQVETGASSWFGFAVLVDDRDAVLADIATEFDVRPVVAGNILRHDVAKFFDLAAVIGADGAKSAPRADRIHDCGFFVGNNPTPCEPALERLVEMLDLRRAA